MSIKKSIPKIVCTSLILLLALTISPLDFSNNTVFADGSNPPPNPIPIDSLQQTQLPGDSTIINSVSPTQMEVSEEKSVLDLIFEIIEGII